MERGFKNSAKNVFRRMNTLSIIVAIITIICGVILLLLPEKTNKVVGTIVGITILLTGLSTIYKYFKRDGAKIYSLSLTFGVIFSILGVLLIVYPYSVMQFVTICFGIAIVISGTSRINNAFWLKKGNEKSWLTTLGSGILVVAIGLLVLFNPFANLTLTRLAGAFLTIMGVLDLVDAIAFSLRSEEIIDIFW